MQEMSLASRRAPASPRSMAVANADASSSFSSDGDEHKSRRPPVFAFASRLSYPAFSARRAAAGAAALGLLFLAAILFLHVRSDVREFDGVYGRYTARFLGRIDGEASHFGILGVPWCRSKQGKTVEWSRKDLLSALEEFVPIYETRPIKNNMYGMGFDHSFGLWFMARWLKPELMIESGAFKGHSTWVLRQAMPDSKIISVTPRHPEKYLKKGSAYVDKNCTYFAGKDFVDFGSMDWQKVLKIHGISDLSRVLVFFDDHQNELKRVQQALKAGFQHLIFEDNYDTGTGDHYSLRQICDQYYIRGGGHSCFKDGDEARIRHRRKMFWNKAVEIDELCGPNEEWWGVRGYMRDDFNHSNKAISYTEHFQNSRFLESALDVYWELPPVAGPSLTRQTRYDPARSPDPIIEDGHFRQFQKLGLGRLDVSVFNGYTQMVYVAISRPSL